MILKNRLGFLQLNIFLYSFYFVGGQISDRVFVLRKMKPVFRTLGFIIMTFHLPQFQYNAKKLILMLIIQVYCVSFMLI